MLLVLQRGIVMGVFGIIVLCLVTLYVLAYITATILMPFAKKFSGNKKLVKASSIFNKIVTFPFWHLQ